MIQILQICKLSGPLSIIKPDDWHAHFRDADMMRLVAPYTARTFARAIAMPNLNPPLRSVDECAAYAVRLRAACGRSLRPLMTLFLHDDISVKEILRAKPDPGRYDLIYGAKLYPRGSTTHAQQGVSDVKRLAAAFAAMEEQDLPLLVHAEEPDTDIDLYDREAVFIDKALSPIREQFPALKMIVEHATSRHALAFVRDTRNTAATITPHHLLYNRNALFEGGLRPHRYCLPPAKREQDRLALIEAACSGDARFFCGTDSAPHTEDAKLCDHGCAGIFNAPTALETYAEIFDAANSLDKLEAFTSINGARFYGVPVNTERLTLHKRTWRAPAAIVDGDTRVTPFRAGEAITWRAAT